MTTLVTVTLVTLVAGRGSSHLKGCSPEVYRVLEDDRRAVTHRLQAGGGEAALCDDLLPPGWYRFMSGGRSLEMAASCPGPAHCGTAHPAWLDPASLGPGPAPGTVSSPVYFRNSDG